MTRYSIQWMAAGVAVLGLAALSFVLGTSLLPTRGVAEARGTLAPWVLTWAIIWLAVLAAVTLASFLIATGFGKAGRPD